MTKHACGRVPWRENDKMQRRRPRRRRMDTYVRGGGAGAACAGAGAGRDQSRPAHCRVVDRSGQGQPSSCCNIEPSDRCAAHVQEICVSSYPPTLLDWWFVRSGRIEHVAVTLVHVRARSSTTTRASERVLSYWLVLHSGRGARGGRPAVRPTTTRAVVAGGGGAHCTHSRRACVGRPWRARSTGQRRQRMWTASH